MAGTESNVGMGIAATLVGTTLPMCKAADADALVSIGVTAAAAALPLDTYAASPVPSAIVYEAESAGMGNALLARSPGGEALGGTQGLARSARTAQEALDVFEADLPQSKTVVETRELIGRLKEEIRDREAQIAFIGGVTFRLSSAKEYGCELHQFEIFQIVHALALEVDAWSDHITPFGLAERRNTDVMNLMGVFLHIAEQCEQTFISMGFLGGRFLAMITDIYGMFARKGPLYYVHTQGSEGYLETVVLQCLEAEMRFRAARREEKAVSMRAFLEDLRTTFGLPEDLRGWLRKEMVSREDLFLVMRDGEVDAVLSNAIKRSELVTRTVNSLKKSGYAVLAYNVQPISLERLSSFLETLPSGHPHRLFWNEVFNELQKEYAKTQAQARAVLGFESAWSL